MSESSERWFKIVGLGLIVWVVPLLAENAFFYLQMYKAQFFSPLIILLGVLVTLVCTAPYMSGYRFNLIIEGWVLGLVWLAICWAGDSLFYLATLKGAFNILGYLYQEGWMHIYILMVPAVCGYLANAIESRSSTVSAVPSVLPIH